MPDRVKKAWYICLNLIDFSQKTVLEIGACNSVGDSRIENLFSIINYYWLLGKFGFQSGQRGAIIAARAGFGLYHEQFEAKIDGNSTFGINVWRRKIARRSNEKPNKIDQVFVFDFSTVCHHVPSPTEKSRKQRRIFGWYGRNAKFTG